MGLSTYQEGIIVDLKQGAKIQSSEGANYKCWLVYPGDKPNRTIRRDTVEYLCDLLINKLVFGDPDGIYIKKT